LQDSIVGTGLMMLGGKQVDRVVKLLAWTLFWAYVVTLILAGAWGIAFARVDFPVLLHQPVDRLAVHGSANVLSQYRFLRAIEFGFGLFAVRYRAEIFTRYAYNRLFLSTMALGVAARGLSIAIDGLPTIPMLSFLGIELLGVVSIFTYTRRTLVAGPRTPA
jgi:hypothetical protein